MEVFRICLKIHAASLLPSGNSARWNSKGNLIIYTAENRSLACLENLVHRSGLGLNEKFSVITIYIPNKISFEEVKIKTLPTDWYLLKNYYLCQQIGDRWLMENKTCLLKVPSSIIYEESNFLINPRHPDFAKITLVQRKTFRFDERLMKRS